MYIENMKEEIEAFLGHKISDVAWHLFLTETSWETRVVDFLGKLYQSMEPDIAERLDGFDPFDDALDA